MRGNEQLNNRFKRAASMAISTVLLFLMFGIFANRGLTATAADAWSSGTVLIPPGEPLAMTSAPSLSAKAAVLMEAESGAVIAEHNANQCLPMASTTKIMTALIAIEQLPLDTIVTVTRESVGVEGSSIYLIEGETLTLEDLLYALLLESANDAAETIAIAVAGNVPAFASLMNERASEMGLTQTHFVNPHGLDDPEHYTTAKELALIAREALANPDFRCIASTKRHTIPLHNTEGVRLLLNHNKLLSSYDGCIGVKTGFTKKTGRCLVSAAEREGLTLIAVTLGAPDDWRDHTALLDFGFSQYESLKLCAPLDYTAPLPLIGGTQDYVMVENTDALVHPIRRDHGEIICVVERRRFEFAPIQQGTVVGRLVFYEITSNGKRPLGAVPLYASYIVEATSDSHRERGVLARLWSWICDLFSS